MRGCREEPRLIAFPKCPAKSYCSHLTVGAGAELVSLGVRRRNPESGCREVLHRSCDSATSRQPMKDSRDLAQDIHESTQPAALAAGYHGDDRWLLLLAALIGVLGALATVAFHEGMAFAETVATGHPGSLVVAAEALAPWRRVITPALGGLVAGALLWWARRTAKGKKQPDYLEAIVIGDGHQDVRGTLLRSVAA